MCSTRQPAPTSRIRRTPADTTPAHSPGPTGEVCSSRIRRAPKEASALGSHQRRRRNVTTRVHGSPHASMGHTTCVHGPIPDETAFRGDLGKAPPTSRDRACLSQAEAGQPPSGARRGRRGGCATFPSPGRPGSAAPRLPRPPARSAGCPTDPTRGSRNRPGRARAPARHGPDAGSRGAARSAAAQPPEPSVSRYRPAGVVRLRPGSMPSPPASRTTVASYVRSAPVEGTARRQRFG